MRSLAVAILALALLVAALIVRRNQEPDYEDELTYAGGGY